MDPAELPGLLNVERLLESSQPQPRVNLGLWLGGLCLLFMLSTALLGQHNPDARQATGILSFVALALMVGGMSAVSVFSTRQLRLQQQQVERIGELVQLQRWPEAAVSLDSYLSRPVRTPQLRTQAFVYLSPVLVRLHRFDDALAVQNYLIDENLVDAGGKAAMRIGRAMAMLHEDHLFDADRAISELRRGPATGSAALALVEICRDVKTGHPAEAIVLFEEKLPILRDQLGHRVADAYALAARAYDLLGREGEARAAFRSATLLAPVGDLFRRYPEVEKLAARFQPATAPPEAA